jgi:hypothetical protein
MKMDKTPRQVAIEAWRECGNDFERKMEHVASAVIAHATPSIEAEARAVAIFLEKLSTYHPTDKSCVFGVHGIAGFFNTASEAFEAYKAARPK